MRYSIGDVSRMPGMTTVALRFYENTIVFGRIAGQSAVNGK